MSKTKKTEKHSQMSEKNLSYTNRLRNSQGKLDYSKNYKNILISAMLKYFNNLTYLHGMSTKNFSTKNLYTDMWNKKLYK